MSSELEVALWGVFRGFEELALRQYEAFCPELAASGLKRRFVEALPEDADSARVLGKLGLQEPLSRLVESARGDSARSTLIVQGLLLELAGRNLYEAVSSAPAASAATRGLAAQGASACRESLAKVPSLIREKIGANMAFEDAFKAESSRVLCHLDALGEAVDRVFGVAFQLRFADVIGNLVTDLIPLCVALGVDRRKLMHQLTSALMGA